MTSSINVDTIVTTRDKLFLFSLHILLFLRLRNQERDSVKCYDPTASSNVSTRCTLHVRIPIKTCSFLSAFKLMLKLSTRTSTTHRLLVFAYSWRRLRYLFLKDDLRYIIFVLQMYASRHFPLARL